MPCLSHYMQEWVRLLEKDDEAWDQAVFNKVMARGSEPLPHRKDGLFS